MRVLSLGLNEQEIRRSVPLVSPKVLPVADPLQSTRSDLDIWSLYTTTLLFHCDDSGEMDRGGGIGAARLRTRFAAAKAACAGRILVVDACRLPPDDRNRLWDTRQAPDEFVVSEISKEAILNEDPYMQPIAIGAAGGYLTRDNAGRRELLLILRRGAWDLPKGKIDREETIRDAAIREVREELGIEDVHVGRSLGTTVHGYAKKEGYVVKTTHWMEMVTKAHEFRPEADEGIERAEWFPWDEAVLRLGYESLRVHTRRIGQFLDVK